MRQLTDVGGDVLQKVTPDRLHLVPAVQPGQVAARHLHHSDIWRWTHAVDHALYCLAEPGSLGPSEGPVEGEGVAALPHLVESVTPAMHFRDRRQGRSCAGRALARTWIINFTTSNMYFIH